MFSLTFAVARVAAKIILTTTHCFVLFSIMGGGDASQKHPDTSVIDLIQNQLLSMNTLLAATIIKGSLTLVGHILP